MADERIGLQVDVETGKVTGEVGNLRKDLRDAERAVAAVSEKFGVTSKEAAAAAKRAAEFRDKIGDARALVDAFNPDRKFQAFSTAVQGVAGGISALQGAMALLGVEGEETQKALLKVQAALALSQGINSILELQDQFKNLMAVLGQMSIVQKANALANNLAAASMRAFGIATTQTSVAFNVLKGAIIATGIGALVVAIGVVVQLVSEWASETERLAEAQKEAAEYSAKLDKAQLEGEIAFVERQKKLDLAKAKARGASEQELFEISQSWEKQRLLSLKRLSDDEKAIKDQEVNLEVMRLERLGKVRDDAASKERDRAAKRAADLKKAMDEQARRDNLPTSVGVQSSIDPVLAAEMQRKEEEKKIADERAAIQNSITENLRKNVTEQIAAKVEANKADEQQAANEKYWSDIRKKIAEQEAQAKVQMYQLVGNGLNILSSLIGEQTAAGKALAIASTTISTYLAAQEAYRSQMTLPTPDAPVRAAIAAGVAIASGLARVKAIMNVKVPKATASVSLPTASAGGGLAPNPIQNTNTTLDSRSIDDISNKAIRAYVVESDNASSAERAKRLSRAGVLNG